MMKKTHTIILVALISTISIISIVALTLPKENKENNLEISELKENVNSYPGHVVWLVSEIKATSKQMIEALSLEIKANTTIQNDTKKWTKEGNMVVLEVFLHPNDTHISKDIQLEILVLGALSAILLKYGGSLGVFIDPLGVAHEERRKDRVYREKDQNAQPGSGEQG